MKCKKLNCSRPAAPSQVYCSREHAPYSHLVGGSSSEKVNQCEEWDFQDAFGRITALALARKVGVSSGMISKWHKAGRIRGERVLNRVYFYEQEALDDISKIKSRQRRT